MHAKNPSELIDVRSLQSGGISKRQALPDIRL